MNPTRTFATVLLAGVSLGLSGLALAQQPAAQPAPAAAPDALAPTEAELRQFAAAALRIEQIRAEAEPRIEAATGEERERMEGETNNRLIEVSEASGLDRDTFNRIAALARSDSAVWERIAGYMNEIEQAEAPGDGAAGS